MTAAPVVALLQGVKFTGGKEQEGVWQRIVNLMPQHSIYVEPFLGGGAVMRLKSPAWRSVGIDKRLHPETVAALSPRHDVQLIEGCGIFYLQELCQRSHVHPSNIVVYCDPPYVHATRRRRNYYRHEMTDADHVELLRVLHRAAFRVILSGYGSDLYASHGFTTGPGLLPGWTVDRFEVTTRGGNRATECLWFNFQRPRVPHDVAHVGADHRQRWRIEKRRRRIRAKFVNMEPAERATLLASLVSVMPADEVRQIVARELLATPQTAPLEEKPDQGATPGTAPRSSSATSATTGAADSRKMEAR